MARFGLITQPEKTILHRPATVSSSEADRRSKVFMHYYQFNIGDYQSHTSHLSLEEDLAYRRLLDWCYLHERPLPKDHKQIARLIRMPTHSECIATVLLEFFQETDDGYFSTRVEQEVQRVNDKAEKARCSARKRWDANALQPQSEGNATQDTIPKTHNTLPSKEKKATVVAHPLTVTEQVWSDWLQIRKAKKLPMTETAWSQIQNEFRKSNLSDQQGVEYCCLSNWASFKTAWYEKNMQEQNSGVSPRVQAKQKVISGLTRGLMGGTNVTLLGK